MSGASTSSTLPVEWPDVTHCSICLETYKEPKALPCLHTFCRICLEQHCGGKVQKLPCPMCRKPFAVPRGGVKNLPNNFFIDQLMQLKQSNKKIKLSVNYCEQHPSQPNRLYCHDCKTLTCHRCFVSKHMTHDVNDVDETAEIFRQELKRDVDNISAYSLKKLEEIKQLDYDTDRFMEMIATTESEISQKYDQLISLIQSHKNELMEELNVFKNKILMEVETAKDKTEMQSAIRHSFNAYVLELINSGTACDISRTAYDLRARAEELVKTQDETECPKLNGVVIKFKPSLSITNSVENFIGKLVLRDLTKLLGSLAVRHVMPGTGQEVSGITVLGDEVFVVRRKSQVYVYKSDDFTLKRTLTITGSRQLHGLVSCSLYKCLYAVDFGQKIIYRYDLTNNVITNWSVSGICCRLSLTKSYHILASLYDTNQIQEYTTSGTLFREISLDDRIDYPWHSAQLSTGNYVVSYGLKQHGVSIVDQSGRIIQSNDEPRMLYARLLINPFHIAVDIHENMLIADSSKNRVQFFSPTLTYIGDIVIPGHQLNNPSTLHFDELNHRLYIGEWTGRRVFVLDINY